MTQGRLIRTMLITLVTVISINANSKKIGSIIPPVPVGGLQTVLENVKYPLFAREARLGSNVLLSFRVDKNGEVSRIKVVESGGVYFDKSAIDAVMSTDWIPATLHEQNIAIRYELPFQFSIK